MKVSCEELQNALREGNVEALDRLAATAGGFARLSASCDESYLIVLAINAKRPESLAWLLSNGANPNVERDGFTPLISCLYVDGPLRYELMGVLLGTGADPNQKGIHTYTPSHFAAQLNDVLALKLLVKWGADLSIETEIDNYANPLGEAMAMQEYAQKSVADAIEYLKSLGLPNQSFNPDGPGGPRG